MNDHCENSEGSDFFNSLSQKRTFAGVKIRSARSPLAVEDVIAASTPAESQGNGFFLWIQDCYQPSAIIHLNRNASTGNALL